MRHKYPKLTKSARGRDCTIRLPGCNGGGETTVFAHAPCIDKGVGFKSPDFWGAFACSHCHGVLDGHIKSDLSKDEKRLAFFYGIYETQRAWFNEGMIRV